MKDFLGNDLEVGDDVVSIELGYKNLYKTKIVKITSKTIFVEAPRKYQSYLREPVKRFSSQIIKIQGEEKTLIPENLKLVLVKEVTR